MEAPADPVWSSIRSNFAVAYHWDLPLLGVARHFHVLTDGRVQHFEGVFFVPGYLLDSWDIDVRKQADAPRVLVRMRSADWHAVGKYSKTLRILHSSLHFDGQSAVIDTTSGMSVVSGAITTVEDTTVCAAEIFSGAFCGWSQAAWMVHKAGYPLHVRWLLDHDASVYDSARMVHARPLARVTNSEELRCQLQGFGDIFVPGCVRDPFWHRLLACPHLGLVATSPPCPPWSTASRGPGLDALDGQLLLHVLAAIEPFQVPCLCLEQVAGFNQHPHYSRIQNAWEEAGYKMVWSRQQDLLDLSPSSRKRFLAVLARKDLAYAVSLSCNPPLTQRRPTLETFQGLMDLPDDLLQPCLLSEDLLRVYMDPDFLPCRGPQSQQKPPLHAYGFGNPPIAWGALWLSMISSMNCHNLACRQQASWVNWCSLDRACVF